MVQDTEQKVQARAHQEPGTSLSDRASLKEASSSLPEMSPATSGVPGKTAGEEQQTSPEPGSADGSAVLAKITPRKVPAGSGGKLLEESLIARSDGKDLSLGQEQGGEQHQLTLDQARALAASQHEATRRPLAGAVVRHTEVKSPSLFTRVIGLFRRKKEASAGQDIGALLQQALSQAAKGGKGGGQQEQSLFSAMNAPLHGLTPDDIKHGGNDIDAALSRRPHFGVRYLNLTVCLFFLCLIVWSAFAQIDEVTHAEGTVVGSQRTQSISNLEGGILRTMLVKEGQTVQRDDILAQLDNQVAASSYRDALNRSMENALAIIRLEAELADKEPTYPDDLKGWIMAEFKATEESGSLSRATQMIKDQKSVHASRVAKYQADEAVLQGQFAQRQKDVQEQKSRRSHLASSLQLAIQQRNAAQALLARKNFSRLEYLNLEEKVVEISGQIDTLDVSIPRAQAAAREAEQRIAAHKAEFDAGTTEEINKRRVELGTLRETLASGNDRVTRTDVRAPVRGIVKQIHVNTIGGVIKPGDPILDIVPLDDTLVVEARVSPEDVAFLRPGQDVMVKVTAYDFSIYGGLEGKLEQISADSIEDKRGNVYFLVKVRTRKTSLIHNHQILPVIPGMIVQSDILIGKKSILQLVMEPFLNAKENALTER